MSLKPGGLKESTDAIRRREYRETLRLQLRRTLNVEEVLHDTLGVGQVQENGPELIHSCILPFGLHSNGDRNPSASFNRDSLKYNCFSCGGGDIFWLMATVLDIDIEQAIVRLTDSLAPRELTAEEFVALLEETWAGGDSPVLEMPRYSERILVPWQRIVPYLTERGIVEDVQREMRTGIDLKNRERYDRDGMDTWIERPRAVIPLFYGGVLRGWQKRKLDSVEYGAKYLSSKGFPRRHTLYGYDNVEGKDVIVVESPASMLKMRSLGYRNVVATLGAEVNQEQMALLHRFDKIYAFMDADPAGHKATADIVEHLEDFVHVYVVPNEMEGTDPADFDRSAIENMMKWAEPSIVWKLANL